MPVQIIPRPFLLQLCLETVLLQPQLRILQPKFNSKTKYRPPYLIPLIILINNNNNHHHHHPNNNNHNSKPHNLNLAWNIVSINKYSISHRFNKIRNIWNIRPWILKECIVWIKKSLKLMQITFKHRLQDRIYLIQIIMLLIINNNNSNNNKLHIIVIIMRYKEELIEHIVHIIIKTKN